MTDIEAVLNAMEKLGMNADFVFDRIQEDLKRGLVAEARMQLNFVDILLTANQNKKQRKQK